MAIQRNLENKTICPSIQGPGPHFSECWVSTPYSTLRINHWIITGSELPTFNLGTNDLYLSSIYIKTLKRSGFLIKDTEIGNNNKSPCIHVDTIGCSSSLADTAYGPIGHNFCAGRIVIRSPDTTIFTDYDIFGSIKSDPHLFHFLDVDLFDWHELTPWFITV